MRYVFNLGDLVVSHIQCSELELKVRLKLRGSYRQMKGTYIVFETFNLRQTVVAEVKLFEVNEPL